MVPADKRITVFKRNHRKNSPCLKRTTVLKKSLYFNKITLFQQNHSGGRVGICARTANSPHAHWAVAWISRAHSQQSARALGGRVDFARAHSQQSACALGGRADFACVHNLFSLCSGARKTRANLQRARSRLPHVHWAAVWVSRTCGEACARVAKHAREAKPARVWRSLRACVANHMLF